MYLCGLMVLLVLWLLIGLNKQVLEMVVFELLNTRTNCNDFNKALDTVLGYITSMD